MQNSVSGEVVAVREIQNRDEWDELVESFGGNPFQLWGWGEVKVQTGAWTALHLAVDDASGEAIGGAMVLLRDLPFPFRKLAYVPRGPFGRPDALTAVADAVTAHVGTHTPAVSITFEPNIDASDTFSPKGGQKSSTDIFLPSTLIIDLTQEEDALIGDMAKKTRYSVRRSLRDGLTVRRAETQADLEICLDIYDETARRADFPLHDREYYRTIFRELGDASPVYMAHLNGVAVAFLWVLATGTTALDLYGGSNEAGLRGNANYGIKWEAMLDQKASGAQFYDLNGLLDEGVSHFKKGFASHTTQLHDGVEIPLSRLHPVWATILPRARITLGAIRRQIRHLKERIRK